MTAFSREFQLKLIEALESGQFKQGKHVLTIVREDGTEEDCCLGVACKIGNVPSVIAKDDAGQAYRIYGAESELAYIKEGFARGWRSGDGLTFIPASARDSMGATSGAPSANGYGLAGLNDDGVDFIQIAQHLRQDLDNADRWRAEQIV